MKQFRYRIVAEWSDEDGAFVARVPALPGCAAHGPNEAAAVHEARKAAEGILAVMAADGDRPPPEDTAADYSGQLRLRIPRSLHQNLAMQADAEGVSLNTLMISKLVAKASRFAEDDEPPSSRGSAEDVVESAVRETRASRSHKHKSKKKTA